MELKHEAEHRKPGRRAFVLVHMRGSASADEHLSCRRQIKQAQQVQQGRFSGTGRSGNRDKLVLAHGQVDILNKRGRHNTGQNARDLAGLDQRRRDRRDR